MNAREKQPGKTVLRRHVIRGVVWLCVLVWGVFVMSAYFEAEASASSADAAGTLTGGRQFNIENEEVIMLVVSVLVLVEIVVGFNFARLIPHKGILLCSFVLFVLSCVFTVAEGFVFPQMLNYAEHLSLAGSAILLAVWCCRMFRPSGEDAG